VAPALQPTISRFLPLQGPRASPSSAAITVESRSGAPMVVGSTSPGQMGWTQAVSQPARPSSARSTVSDSSVSHFMAAQTSSRLSHGLSGVQREAS